MRSILVMIGCAGFALLATERVRAAEGEKNPPAPLSGDRCGVVDTLEISNRSLAFQDLQNKFKAQIQADQAYIDQKEKAFRERDQTMVQELHRLNQQQNLPQKEEDSNRLISQRHLYEHEVAQFQEIMQKRKEYIEEVFRTAKLQIQDAIDKVVSDIAKSNTYTVVFQKPLQKHDFHSPVMYIETGRDITEKVILEINKRLTQVDIKVVPLEIFAQRNIPQDNEGSELR